MTTSAEILLTIKLQNALFIDPKRIRLLKEIQACGSINQAAKNAQVSYKSAWDHLEAMNNISPKPLIAYSLQRINSLCKVVLVINLWVK